jgi:hypothetical protein
VNGQVSQNLAVNFDTGQVEAINEAAVAHAVFTTCSINALDPKLTEVTLAGTTVSEAVKQAVHNGFVCGSERTAAVTVVTLRLLHRFFVGLLSVYAIFYACHVSFLSGLNAEHLFSVRSISWGQDSVTGEATGTSRAFVLQLVIFERTSVHDFAGTREAKTLLGGSVGFHLWHVLVLR